MTSLSPKVVFFGSGPVAAQSLVLLGRHCEIETVITKPKPSHHRGSFPVLEVCEQKKLPYHTPTNKSELNDLFATHNFSSKLGVVIDYGIIISQEVIDYFPLGIINSHFSLLPQWRGADPITFSILSGQKETGVSLMSIDAALDEGPILSKDKIVIQADENATSLTQKLILLSDKMLKRDLPRYIEGSLNTKPQTGEPSYSRKLTKADGKLDWNKPAAVLEREIRAYFEWPKSVATIGNMDLIVREADVVNTSGNAGDYVATKKELTVYCGDKALRLKRVQPLNKKEMPVEAFLAGYAL